MLSFDKLWELEEVGGAGVGSSINGHSQ